MPRFETGTAWVALKLDDSDLRGGQAKRLVERHIGHPDIKPNIDEKSVQGRSVRRNIERQIGRPDIKPDVNERSVHGGEVRRNIERQIGRPTLRPDIKPERAIFQSAGRTSGQSFGSGFKGRGGFDRDSAKQHGRGIGMAFGGAMAAAAGSLLAAVGIVKFFQSSISEATEAQQVGRQTAAVIKSTGGAAGVSQAQVEAYADKLSKLYGVDDEVIQSHENVLLTFTKVHGKVFEEAVPLIEDYATAMKIDGKNAAIQLGKALQDPVKGINAMRRAGVSFTDEQRAQIKTLVEHGHIQEAQKIILGEVRKEFEGSAKAQATAAMKQKVAWQNLQESVGKLILPLLEKVETLLTEKVIPGVQHFVDALRGVDQSNSIWAKFGQTMRKVFDFLGKNPAVLAAMAVGLGAVIAGFVALNVVMAITAALEAGVFWPVTLFVAIAAALAFLYVKFQWFRTVVKVIVMGPITMFKALAMTTIWLWKNVMAPAFHAIGVAGLWMYQHAILPASRGIGVAIRALGATGSWLSRLFSSVARSVASAWNWLYAKAIAPIGRAIGVAIRALGAVGSWLARIFSSVVRTVGSLWNWLYAKVISPVSRLIQVWLRGTGVVATWLYRNAILPAARGIAAIWNWLYAKVISPVSKLIQLWFKGIGIVAAWMYNKAVLPAVRSIGAIWRWLYEKVISPVGKLIQLWWRGMGVAINVLRNSFQTAVRAIATAWGWLYSHSILPVGRAIRAVWDALKAAFNNVRATISNIIKAIEMKFEEFKFKAIYVFQSMKDRIASVWNGIKHAVSAPVKAVIDVVYNKGIVSFWNAVVSKIPGVKNMSTINFTGFAQGGYTGDGDRDEPAGIVHKGEWVIPKHKVPMYRSLLHKMTYGYADGGEVIGLPDLAMAGLPGYKKGGIVGSIINVAKDGINWAKSKIKDLALGTLIQTMQPLINGIKGAISGIIPNDKSQFGNMIRGLPTEALNQLLNFVQSKDVAPVSLGGVGWQGPLGGAVPYIIALMKRSKIPFSVTSTTRNEPGSYHGTGNAVDFIGPNMTKIAQYWYGMSPALLEEIHSPSWFVKKGKRVSADFYRAVYAQHFNHVHIAATKRAMQAILSGAGGSFSKLTGSHTNLMLRALALVHRPSSWLNPLNTLITRESGWNPNAINRTDINAQRGDPSRGLMQTIGATFSRYRLASLPNNIYDPLANIVAGLRYIIARYGTIFNVQQAVGSTPHGYDAGGWLMDGMMGINRSGKPEPVFTDAQWKILKANISSGARAIQVTLDLKDVKDVRDVVEFMEKIEKTARAGVRKP